MAQARAVKHGPMLIQYLRQQQFSNAVGLAKRHPECVTYVDWSGEPALCGCVRRNQTTLTSEQQSERLRAAKVMIDLGASASTSYNDLAPIHYAAYDGDNQLMDVLLSCSADVDVPMKYSGKTALIICSERGNEKGVRLLMHKGANALLTDNRYMTALHHAVEADHVKIVELLLADKDEDKNKELASMTGLTDKTALVMAAQLGLAAVFAKVLPFASWPDIMEALSVACEMNHAGIVRIIFKYTMEHYSTWPGKDAEDQQYPLVFAARAEDPAARQEILKIFLDLDCLVHKDMLHDGQNALHHAAFTGDLETIKTLVKRARVDVASTDANGGTVFHILAMQAPSQIAREIMGYLIDECKPSLDLLRQAHHGRTALDGAIINGDKEMALMLIDKGVTLSLREITKIIHLEVDAGPISFIAEHYPPLMDMMRDTDLLYYAAKTDKGLPLLRKGGAHLAGCIRSYAPPMYTAAAHGCVENLRFLVGVPAVKATINQIPPGSSYTPLGTALSNRHLDCAWVLLAAGADPAAMMLTGDTVLEKTKILFGRWPEFESIIKHMEDMVSVHKRLMPIYKARIGLELAVPECLSGRFTRNKGMPTVSCDKPSPVPRVLRTRRKVYDQITESEKVSELRGFVKGTMDLNSDMFHELLAYMTRDAADVAKAAAERHKAAVAASSEEEAAALSLIHMMDVGMGSDDEVEVLEWYEHIAEDGTPMIVIP